MSAIISTVIEGNKEIVRYDSGRIRVRTLNSQPSKTDQSYKEDCDANNIIRKFNRTGMVTHVSKVQGKFADVSDVPDLLQGMERINEAKEAFMEVPAKIRAKFDNDVSKFYEYVSNPENHEEMVKMGLAEKRKHVSPDIGTKTKVEGEPDAVPKPTGES